MQNHFARDSSAVRSAKILSTASWNVAAVGGRSLSTASWDVGAIGGRFLSIASWDVGPSQYLLDDNLALKKPPSVPSFLGIEGWAPHLYPHSGVLRTQKLKTHLLNTRSSKVLPFKPGAGP